MRRSLLLLSLLALASLLPARDAAAQSRAAGFRGDWNYAVYAKDKSELPPAYQSMKLEEVPLYAIDITIRQSGGRLRATCGIVARFLARIEDCDFNASVRGGAAQFNLRSSFGGTATVRLTLEGGTLRWKTLRRRGESYYPADIVLRRLKPGETPPYFEKEGARLSRFDRATTSRRTPTLPPPALSPRGPTRPPAFAQARVAGRVQRSF